MRSLCAQAGWSGGDPLVTDSKTLLPFLFELNYIAYGNYDDFVGDLQDQEPL